MVTCSLCNATQYSRHNIPWHTNMTYEEYEISLSKHSKSIEKKSKKIIKIISKKCPKCDVFINKNRGCRYMTCSKFSGVILEIILIISLG